MCPWLPTGTPTLIPTPTLPWQPARVRLLSTSSVTSIPISTTRTTELAATTEATLAGAALVVLSLVFVAIVGSQGLLEGMNRLWIRFFQLAVFATMFVRDHTRPHLHHALGLDTEENAIEVFRIVQEVSKQVFPVLIDVEHPAFLEHLRHLQLLSARIMTLREQGIVGRIKALPLQLRAGATFARMYFLPTRANALPDELRMAAAW